MNVTRFLVVNSRGTCKIHNRYYPDIAADEVCISLNLNIPDEIFTRPRLVANITIPAKAAEPEEISSEILVNTKDAIEQATGLTFAINVVRKEVEGEAKP